VCHTIDLVKTVKGERDMSVMYKEYKMAIRRFREEYFEYGDEDRLRIINKILHQTWLIYCQLISDLRTCYYKKFGFELYCKNTKNIAWLNLLKDNCLLEFSNNYSSGMRVLKNPINKLLPKYFKKLDVYFRISQNIIHLLVPFEHFFLYYLYSNCNNRIGKKIRSNLIYKNSCDIPKVPNNFRKCIEYKIKTLDDYDLFFKVNKISGAMYLNTSSIFRTNYPQRYFLKERLFWKLYRKTNWFNE